MVSTMIRLDKYLADSGYGTRSEVRSFLRIGEVTVNGEVVKDGARKIDPKCDIVARGGKAVEFSEFEYYMLHKPAGIITASRDKKEKTVIDLIDSKKRRDLFPVGRLDRDTEGLLLITNDGELSHRLLSPKKHIEKRYIALVSGVLPENIAEEFEKGIDIGDEKLTKPSTLRRLDSIEETGDPYIEENYERLAETFGSISIMDVGLTEGRYHEIKRMFEAFGGKVEYLKRISMGGLKLDKELSLGGYRKLTEEEVEILKRGTEEGI